MAGMLSGIRVLALENLIAGPYGSMILGDLGAEVIKIEPPEGDLSRGWTEFTHRGESYYYLAFNRNKKSLVLDLGTKSGREAFHDLVKISDVVWDNFRPGVMERLSADYETLKRINPKIICCSVTGYGSSGPYRDRSSYDLIVQAMSGIMSITGEPGRPPVRCGPPITDLAAGMFGAHGVMAALYAREQTGKGQRIDVSLLDSAISLLSYYVSYYSCSGLVPGPLRAGHFSVVPYQVYDTKEGHIAIGFGWPGLAKALGLDEMIDDPRFKDRQSRIEHREAFDALVEQALGKAKAEDWLAILNQNDVPCGLVNNIAEALADPQVLHRNMILSMEHPLGGEIKIAGSPIKTPKSQQEEYAPPPVLGQHNEEILNGLLGY